jgi:hypothetical protein
MSVATATEPNLGRPKAKKTDGDAGGRRFSTLVRVADDVAQVARELAPMLGVSMAELLSDILRPILQEKQAAEMKKRLGGKR